MNGVLLSGSYLGPHACIACNKAVCRCAVCSSFKATSLHAHAGKAAIRENHSRVTP